MSTVRFGESISLWADSEHVPSFGPLENNIDVDVCIVGGGIAGLTTAYLLAKEGKEVCVLEDSTLGSGQTGKTTAHFTTVLDKRFHDLERDFGAKQARCIIESHLHAIETVENIVRQEGIECDLARTSGYLFGFKDQNSENLKGELKSALNLGLDVELRITAPLMSFETGPCLRFPNQMQLHPLKYLSGLAQAIIRMEGKIFTNTHVAEIHGGDQACVKTKNGFRVTCDHLVVATNSPVNNIFAIHTKQSAYRSYVIGFRVPQGIAEKALFWDIQDPYHYVRVAASEVDGEEILLVGGADHKTGQDDFPEENYKKLEEWAREKFIGLKDVTYRWSGQVMEPIDGIAYLGRNPFDSDNVYVITGTSGNGMTYSTIGAILITDQVMGRENAWEKIYDPGRVKVSGVAEFLRENSNVAAQYAGWFRGGEVIDLDLLPHGEGVVYRHGLKQIAAYKDNDGSLHTFSAACPHLGGVVQWNSAERSWDCPCHGSRFDCHGKVIEGPAISDLRAVSEEKYSPKLPAEPIIQPQSQQQPF